MSNRIKVASWLIIAGLLYFAAAVSAQTQAPAPAPAPNVTLEQQSGVAPAVPAAGNDGLQLLKDIQVHAFASSTYLYNFNDPASNTNKNRFFDTDHNAFKFDIGELVLLKEAANPGDVGFRTDITYGFSVPAGAKAGTIAPNVAGARIAREDFDLQQGYVSYNAPIGNGIHLDFGKFVTHVGLETFEGYDNWNYNYSKALLYGYGQPFTHTGLRAAYSFSDRLSVMGMVANGWDATTDTNGSKTFGLQVAGKPTDTITMFFNYAGGPEGQAANMGNDSNWRHIFDFIVDIAITQKLSFVIDATYAFEENASPMPDRLGRVGQRDARWGGVEGIARYKFNDWSTLNVRVEYYEDKDGFRSPRNTTIGILPGQEELWEFSITPEFRINKNLVVRPEFRHDESNRLSFDTHGGALRARTQNTIAINTMFFF